MKKKFLRNTSLGLFFLACAATFFFYITHPLVNRFSLFNHQYFERVLIIDLKNKSGKNFPTFLPENSAILIFHKSRNLEDHKQDIIDSREVVKVADINNKLITNEAPNYLNFELLFLKKAPRTIELQYFNLSQLGIKAIYFYPDYIANINNLYKDKFPHGAGDVLLSDGTKRLMRDIWIQRTQ